LQAPAQTVSAVSSYNKFVLKGYVIADLGGPTMKLSLAFIILVFASTTILAQQSDTQMKMSGKPVELLPGLGSLHHPTSTKNPEAQSFFDQGFRMIYGFNHEEAVRSFKRAAELDPQMAMAWWGIGVALGPNINQDVDPYR